MGWIVAGLVPLVVPGLAHASLGLGAGGDAERSIGVWSRFVGAVSSIGPFEGLLSLAGVGILVWAWLADAIRPGSLRPSRVRRLSRADAWVFAFGAFGLFALTTALPGLALELLRSAGFFARQGLGDLGRDGVGAIVVYGLGVPLALGAAVIVGRAAGPRRPSTPSSRAAPRSPSADSVGAGVRGDDLVRGLLLGLAFFPVAALVSIAVNVGARTLLGLAPDPIAHDTLKRLTESNISWAWWAVVAGAVVGAPIVEEVLYRGMLQSALASFLEDRWPAILITSALFAGVHATIAPAYVLPLLAALGIAMGVVYERTGRLWLCIVMHATFNAINLGLAMLIDPSVAA